MRKIIIICAVSALAIVSCILSFIELANAREASAGMCDFYKDGLHYVCKGKLGTCIKGVTPEGSSFKCSGKAYAEGMTVVIQ